VAQHSIRILVADDHSIVLEGLRALLSQQRNMKIVAEARDWLQTVQVALQHRPDIVLADLHMPGGDAAAAISEITRRFSSAKVIVFSAFDTEEEVYQTVRAGARGYVLKGVAGKRDLLACIDSVLKGQVWVHPSDAARLAERMNGPALTKRQIDIVHLVVAGKSNKEIASTLGVEEGTVKVHLNHIFGKLGVTSRTEAISAALERGLVRLSSDF
jgi:two-component system NarL family response regulator